MCSIYAILGLLTVTYAYGKKNIILKHDCKLNTKLFYLCGIFVANKISFVEGHSACADLNQSTRAHRIYLQSFQICVECACHCYMIYLYAYKI